MYDVPVHCTVRVRDRSHAILVIAREADAVEEGRTRSQF